MLRKRLSSDTITILVPVVGRDPRDNTVYYTFTEGAVVEGCSFQPFLITQKFQEEFTTERDTSRAFFRVYMPWTSDTEQITDKYQIRFDGEDYEVHSLVGKWKDFRRAKNHIALLVKKRSG